MLGEVNDRSVHGIGYQEAVYVFRQGGWYYMLTDPHRGLSAYSSRDGIRWTYLGQVLESGSSDRTLDWSQARHPSVWVRNGRKAYLVYHVEPFRPDGMGAVRLEKHQRYAFLQMREIRCESGRMTVM